jgi:hypothetical protein
MGNILLDPLYPMLSQEMQNESGMSVGKYTFSYSYRGKFYDLQQKGKEIVKLTDPLDLWNIETEGLCLKKEIQIVYPNLLVGEHGIICEDADLGLCIIWTNKTLTQTGYILPQKDIMTRHGRICDFDYSFEPGTISGDLELKLVAYVQTRATKILPGEETLINEEGVIIGEPERIILDFNSLYMEFPIEEMQSEKEPLWWVEFSEWEDPKTIDMFTKDSLCLFLNPYYKDCPAPSTSAGSNTINNLDLLVDILSQTYLMIFQRLSEDDLKATKQNIGLQPNTICSIMYQFIEDCNEELHWESPEKLLKSLEINIRNKLQEES